MGFAMESPPVWYKYEATGSAIFNFIANGEHQISLTVGDQIGIKERTDGGWYRGINGRTARTGIFPSSYVRISPPVDSITSELGTVLREWHGMLKGYYRDRKMGEFRVMKERLTIMFTKFNKIMSTTDLTTREALKKELLKMVEQGRKNMGLDILVRCSSGEPADDRNTPIISLYHMYKVASREALQYAQPAGGTQSTLSALRRIRAFTMQNLIHPTTTSASATTLNTHPHAHAAARVVAGGAVCNDPLIRGEEEELLLDEEQKEDGADPVIQLYMQLKIFMCSVGEEAELCFYLYHKDGRRVSEEHIEQLTHQGMPHDTTRIDKMYSVFTDITYQDICSNELYLICNLIRKGKLVAGSEAKKSSKLYRRPFACATLQLTSQLLSNITSHTAENKDYVITIPILAAANEASFHNLPDSIIRNSSSTTDVPKAKGVCVGLRMHRGEYSSVCAQNPLLYQCVPPTPRVAFPPIVLPGYSRNDMYFTLELGEFLQDRKTAQKNVEVVVQVRKEDGTCLRNAISIGSGVPLSDEFRSYVIYHSNTPRWFETFRLVIPTNLWSQVHLYVVMKHSTSSDHKDKGSFAFAFMRIMNEDRTIVANKSYTLNSYKIKKKNIVVDVNEPTDTAYLKLPSVGDVAHLVNNNKMDPNGRFVLRKGEFCKVKTALYSTKFTQNSGLLGLLNWNGAEENLIDILKRFMFVDVVEVMKFAPATFNALFAMLTTQNDLEKVHAVYDAIVHTITLFIDDKKGTATPNSQPLRQVLDIYIDLYFHSHTAHRPLLACMLHHFAQHANLQYQPNQGNASSSRAIATLKALEYLLKIVVRSRQLMHAAPSFQVDTTQESHVDPSVPPCALPIRQPTDATARFAAIKADPQFQSDLLDVFSALNMLMRLKGRTYVGAQAAAIKNFASMLVDMEQIFSITQLAGILSKFIDSVQYSDDLKLLNTEKLFFIYNLISGTFYRNEDCIRVLNPVLAHQMKAHLAGIVARRAAAALHISPIPSSPIISPPSSPALSHSSSLAHLTANNLPRQSVGLSPPPSPMLGHTMSVSSIGSPSQSPRSAPAPTSTPSTVVIYPEAPSLPIPPLPVNAEEELIQCTFILYVMLDAVHNKMKDDEQVLHQIYSILPELYLVLKPHPECSPPLPGDWKLDLVTIIINIFWLMKPKHLSQFIDSVALTNTEKLQFLQNTYDTLGNMIIYPAWKSGAPLMYPENWFALSMLQYAMVYKAVEESFDSLSSLSIKVHTPKSPSKLVAESAEPIVGGVKPWRTAVRLMVMFLTCRALQLETFAGSKQVLIMERYGDLRLQMIPWLQKTWNSLGEQQLQLLPELVGPLLELMLCDDIQVREIGMEMYYSLLQREYNTFHSFRTTEKETISTIDRITAQDDLRVDTNFRPFFTRKLAAKFNEEYGPLHHVGMTFLNDITQLLSLLLALRTLPKGEAYEDDRTIATMKLMEYLKQTDRKDTYVKYVHQLCQQHFVSANYTEAALTLLLHADLLGWSSNILSELQDPPFPEECESTRKERLYHEAVNYLDKAKEWERAITLVQPLKKLYEDTTFEYSKLADVLTKEAALFRSIDSSERFFCEYFRVGYYGRGFDSQIHGKEFIYRGFELERLADFIPRILLKFPHAIILNYTDLPPPEVINGEGQHLQIFSVKPCPPLTLPVSSSDKKITSAQKTQTSGAQASSPPPSLSSTYMHPNVVMPLAVQRFHQNNNINTFLYSKPIRKDTKQGNEHTNLWVINHYYITEDTFPTIHRRSEIIRHHEVELSPIDNALAAVNLKNNELHEMIERYQKRTVVNISPFTMILKGVISADVGGGAKMYKNAFFTEEFAKAHPEKVAVIQQLHSVLQRQLALLEKGLALHRNICHQELSPLQLSLEQALEETKAQYEL
eukprot:Phypoly_transcript_00045.p1 GENE.Phypoly_transcript_00045~~Phypoly_transcript_00045.p1  ORF type:complete len:1883 (+),score=230.21 Phypoly_transcript_00045:40-5688(+)